MAEPKRSWTYIPPAWTGEQVEGASLLPIGRYKMPDGTEQVSFGLPQSWLDAATGMSQALGYSQDPNAPEGYVSRESLRKGGQGLAEGAAVGSIASRAPAGALRSGMARSGGDLDPSQAARMARAREMGYGDEVFHGSPDFRGVKEAGEFEPRTTSRFRQSSQDMESVPQPVYFSPDRSLARTYADDTRAFDYQNAEPEVFSARLREGKTLELDAGGSKFSQMTKDAIRRQLPESEQKKFDEILNDYAAGGRDNIRTGDVEILAHKLGYDGFRIKNVKDTYTGGGKPSTIQAIFDPSRIRSTNAMFDPAKSDSANILAANARPGAAVGATMSAARREALDPSQAARMARKLEMGFEDQAVYRGMLDPYDPAQAEYKPQWFSSEPGVAGSYTGAFPGDTPSMMAEVVGTMRGNPQIMPAYIRPGNMIEIDAKGRPWSDIRVSDLPDNVKAVFPEFMHGSAVYTDDVVKRLRGPNQPDTIRFRNINDHANASTTGEQRTSDVTVVLNPANIRSPQAMFDPARINETDPLAANPMAGAVPLAWLPPEEER